MNKQIIPLNRGINKNGGAFWCQNIAPARDDGVYAGLSLNLRSIKTTSSSVTDNLAVMTNFAQIGKYSTGASMSVWGKDSTGDIHLMNYVGTYVCKAASYGQTNSNSVGLCVDPQGSLLYAGNRYIGKAIETTLSATCAITATACSLTSTANFGASGYALIKDIATANSEVIQYTGKSATGLTGLTRARNYTTARQHLSTAKVYFFDDDWKDLGASDTTSRRVMKIWEDKTLIANGRYVATIDSSGTLVTDALTLPAGYDVVDFGFVPTGSSSRVLVCANKDETGKIFVWDGSDDTWTTTIELENITCADGVFIATDLGVYECNGANINLFWRNPDTNNTVSGRTFTITDLKEKGEYILIATSASTSYLRNRAGLWIVSKNTGDSYFVADAGLGNYSGGIYSIFNSSENFTFCGSYYGNGSIQYLDNLPLANGSQYWYLFKPANAQTIKLKKVKLNVGVDTCQNVSPETEFDFDVVVRYYDFTRPFNQTARLKSGETTSVAGTLVIGSTMGVPQVGDRIEIIDRTDDGQSANAGCPRNITAVTAGTGKYTLTLDEDLPNTTSTATYSNESYCLITPLKKAGKVSVNGNINLQDMTFYIPDQPEGKKFIFEIEVRCGHTSISPELNYMEVYYDILD
jgi:hypothetical protein